MKLSAVGFFVVSTAFLASCGGPPNSLEGSIEESFSLEFDRVEIRKQGLSLLIEYLRDAKATTSADKVCKIVLDTENLPLKDNSVVKGDTFLERVTISRVATTGGDFPDLRGGEIKFEKFEFKHGGHIDGEFSVVFVNGRTLHGTFDDAGVEEVPLN